MGEWLGCYVPAPGNSFSSTKSRTTLLYISRSRQTWELEIRTLNKIRQILNER